MSNFLCLKGIKYPLPLLLVLCIKQGGLKTTNWSDSPIIRNLHQIRRINKAKNYLGSEVFKDGSRVDGSGGSDATVRGGPALQVPVDTADRELKSGPGRTRNCFGLSLARIFTSFASGHCCGGWDLVEQTETTRRWWKYEGAVCWCFVRKIINLAHQNILSGKGQITLKKYINLK